MDDFHLSTLSCVTNPAEEAGVSTWWSTLALHPESDQVEHCTRPSSEQRYSIDYQSMDR